MRGRVRVTQGGNGWAGIRSHRLTAEAVLSAQLALPLPLKLPPGPRSDVPDAGALDLLSPRDLTQV